MELDADSLDLLTLPATFREQMEMLRRQHEKAKKAKRDYYYRNKEVISEKRKAKYQELKKSVAEGGETA
jgi:hypothetical protein